MNITWTDDAWTDYLYWQRNDKKVLKRINLLIKDMKREAFEGLGKPEPLRYELAGCWSRRITDEHRLVYELNKFGIVIISCRFHYYKILGEVLSYICLIELFENCKIKPMKTSIEVFKGEFFTYKSK